MVAVIVERAVRAGLTGVIAEIPASDVRGELVKWIVKELFVVTDYPGADTHALIT